MLLPILLQEQKKFVKVRVWRWSRASFRIAGEGILREKEGANSLSFISNRTEQFLDLVLLVSQENNYGGSVMWWPNLWLFDINVLPLYQHILLLICNGIFSPPMKCFSLPLDSRLEDFAGGEAGSRWFCAACQVLHNFPLPHNPLVKV